MGHAVRPDREERGIQAAPFELAGEIAPADETRGDEKERRHAALGHRARRALDGATPAVIESDHHANFTGRALARQAGPHRSRVQAAESGTLDHVELRSERAFGDVIHRRRPTEAPIVERLTGMHVVIDECDETGWDPC